MLQNFSELLYFDIISWAHWGQAVFVFPVKCFLFVCLLLFLLLLWRLNCIWGPVGGGEHVPYHWAIAWSLLLTHPKRGTSYMMCYWCHCLPWKAAEGRTRPHFQSSGCVALVSCPKLSSTRGLVYPSLSPWLPRYFVRNAFFNLFQLADVHFQISWPETGLVWV